jgi:hypothetical protein
MCQTQSLFTHVRIIRCEHGTNYVSLGNITLALNDAELVLIDQAIHLLAVQHPAFRRALYGGPCTDSTRQNEGVI